MVAQLESLDPAPWLALLEARFGIPAAVFDGFILIRQNAKYIAIVAHDHAPPAQLPRLSTGLPFIGTTLRFPKLTTTAALLFGCHATRNFIDLDRAEAEAYMSREALRLSEAQTCRCTDTGYVLIRHDGVTLGLAFYRPEPEGNPTLTSLYPKVWAGQNMS